MLGKTFPQLQRTRDYYRINDVDIDRYNLDTGPTEVVLSLRDLNSANVPQKSWAGQHLAYTHGYGAIVAPANAKDSSGEPDFIAKNVPYDTNVPALKLDQPSVYFGEDLSSYVVTGTQGEGGPVQRRQRHRLHDLQRHGRRQARQHREAGRVRAPLR